MSMDIQLFTSPAIELVDTPVEHVLDIDGVVPGDFTGISVNPYGYGNHAKVEILKDVVEVVTEGGTYYTIRHTVTLQAITQHVVCNLIGVLIHNSP
jgi:hypothetical protein